MGDERKDHPAAGRHDPSRSRRWSRFVLAAVASAAVCLPACRPNKRYDLVEAELRTREKELAETRAALEQARLIARANGQPPAYPGAPVPAAPAGDTCPVREITIGRGTGGIDEDGLPGDEAFMVVIVPQDEDRSGVKVVARATVAAWEVNTAGLKNPIGTWEIPADKLRPTWRTGLFATGYFVTLPWQTFPSTERVRVAVRLVTADGRTFEADREITVRPLPQAYPRANPPQPAYPVVPPVTPPGGRVPLLPGTPPPGVPPAIPPGTEELPPPAGLPGRGATLLPPVKE